MEEQEFEINFTDITLNETDADFIETDALMRKEPPHNEKWSVRSNISILGPAGMGEMTIQCHGSKEVFILDYTPSIGDVFYNPDIQAFSVFMQEKGWNSPQPHVDLIYDDRYFWKHFYDTNIIDSNYFDEVDPRNI